MKLTILGSTGSIGTQSLDVARRMNYKIGALCANKSVEKMEEQIREFAPIFAVMSDESAARDLKVRVADTTTRVLSGEEAISFVASDDSCDTVLNSLLLPQLMPEKRLPLRIRKRLLQAAIM